MYGDAVRWNAALAKTDEAMVRSRPGVGVVLGHVGDIGEAVRAAIPFERVSTTTYPSPRGIPIVIMEEAMAVRKKVLVELAHPNAAGIDIGSARFCRRAHADPPTECDKC